jgi:hypothetical protein
MRLYVHIGTHKTGTTSIQAFLRHHSRSLARSGIFVPETGVPHGESGHHNIAWGLRGDPRFLCSGGTLDDLIVELAGSSSPAGVISSEDFEYLVDKPDALARLDKRLRDACHESRYIVFARRADTYVMSLYAELVHHHGLTMSFREFAREILRTGKVVTHNDWAFYFDMDAFARKWRQVVHGPLSIHSYDSAMASKGIVPTFLSLIEAPDDLVCSSRGAGVLNTRKAADIPAIDSFVSRLLLRCRFKPIAQERQRARTSP